MEPACHILAIFAAVAHGHDVIVATDRRLLMVSGGNSTTTLLEYETAVTGYRTVPLAADPVNSRVYFALPHPAKGGATKTTIGYVNVLTSPKPQPVVLLSTGRNDAVHARGLAYDHVRGVLFWTSMISHSIQRCAVAGRCEAFEVASLHEWTEPAAIAVDPYRGYLFWTNNNHTSPSVNRISLEDKGSTMQIATEGLFMPNGLAIDTSLEGTVYWADDSKGDAFKIESARLDGSNRRTVYSGFYQKPMDLTFARPSSERPGGVLCWSDWLGDCIWCLDLGRRGGGPASMAPLGGDHRDRPMGIVTKGDLGQRGDEVEKTPP